MTPKLIRLKRTYVDPHNGNVYPYTTRPIPATSVPSSIWGDTTYVEVIEANESTTDKSIPVNDSDVEVVEINTKSEPIEVSKFVDVTVKSDDVVEGIEQELQQAININEATEDELLALKGVGKAIAERIIKERQERRFESMEDLKARVPLRFGTSRWEAFNLRFE